MRLKKLELTNFMGIRHFVLEPDGKDVSVFGRNATGKTTIATAISWLLFDKDTHGKAQFEIKTLNESGEPVHNLDHTVIGVFDVNGKEIALQKTYKEKWTQKRGSSRAEHTGHTTDYFVNEVPVQMKAYKEKVAEIADEAMFRLLTTPSYFPEQLHWQKRREILLDVCGDITDQDVIDANPALKPLGAVLAVRSLEEHKKKLKADMAKINDQLKLIPARIDEQQRSITDEELDELGAKDTVVDAEKKIAQLQAKRAEIKAGNQDAGLNRELAAAEKELFEIEGEHRKELSQITADKERELRKLQSGMTTTAKRIDETNYILASKEKEQPGDQRETIKEELAKLKNEWFTIKALVFLPEVKFCPTCGQELPEEADAEEKFNRRKAERLEANEATGRQLSKELAQAEKDLAEYAEKQAAELKKLRNGQAALETENANLQLAFDILQKEIDAIRSRPASERPDYKEVSVRIADIKARMEKAQAGDNTEELEKIDKEIAGANDLLAEARRIISAVEARNKAVKRIKELEAEEKRLSKLFGDFVSEEDLINLFTRTKVSMLEEKINSKFELARFKLFKEQLNEGLQECCEVTFGGIPYSTGLNNGARVAVGIDIIKTLSRHYGFAPPIIIDNAESINQIPETDCQVISLRVSEEDTDLRVETEEMAEAA